VFLRAGLDEIIPEYLCLIHDFKPACCREWQSGLDKAECREGLKSIWDLIVEPAGQISGRPEKMSVFEGYIESLK
jgi:hypothetical protein